ncbi:MAG: hypothetical protein ACREUT_05845 [Steroidobacteraceae bacterium]
MRSPEHRRSFGAGRKIRRTLPVCLCAGLTACAMLHSTAARAETIVVNDKVMVRDSNVARPTGGMRMEQVEKKFGEPTKRHPTVGKPPITRWDYPQFSVFFEGDRVIHTVVIGEQPAHS